MNLQPHDDELLAQLRAKYERPAPGACAVCGNPLAIEPHSGGLPLQWSCAIGLATLHRLQSAEAAAPVLADAEEHVRQSVRLDYRRVGDARVMELIERYESLRAPDTAAAAA